MYHSVSEFQNDPFGVTVTPEIFRRQMLWLRRQGLKGTSVTDLLGATDQGNRGIVGLTFDDGYSDFATTAVPILLEFGFTATAYVLAGELGGVNRWDQGGPEISLMTADQVLQVAAAGMEVGSHGLTHVSLPNLSDTELATQVVCSKAVLSELLDQEVNGFAYPYGHLTSRESYAVQSAGYRHACGVGRAIPGSTHVIPRSYISQRDKNLRMSAKELRHTLWWRAAR